MSDFDKFFADKLSQEHHFPGRAKNWQVLNKRLDAYAIGGAAGAQAASLVWKVVAGSLLATTTFLVFKFAALSRSHQELQQQQQQLQQQVAQLQYEKSLLSSPNPSATSSTQQSPAAQTYSSLPAKPAYPSTSTSRPAPSSLTSSPAYSPAGNAVAAGMPAVSPLQQPSTTSPPDAPRPNGRAEEGSAAAAPVPADPARAAATPPAEVPGAQPPASAAAPQTLPADTAETSSASVAQAVAPDSSTINSASPLGAAPAEPPADTLQKPAAAPPAAAVAEQPVIKPVRRHFQVRAGGSLLTGWDRPHRLGISPLRGQGLSASVSLWRSRLWLTAGADWMRLKEDAPVYWNEYHPSATPPKPFKGGGPHQHYEELVRVQSTQRQNRFQLGLRYELPSIWRLRPTVQAGHVWAKNASAFVRYTYEDKDPGGPWPGSKSFDFVAEEEPKYTHSQIWLAGAGLEYDLRDWTFHVRTEYQAQTGSVAQPTFDALLLRAGLEYRIR